MRDVPLFGGTSRVLYVCGSTADVEQLTRYLANAAATTTPFNVRSVLAHLTRAVTRARTENADALRIPLPIADADPLKGWLEKDARRLANSGYATMNALLGRISFED